MVVVVVVVVVVASVEVLAPVLVPVAVGAAPGLLVISCVYHEHPSVSPNVIVLAWQFL